MFSNKRFEQNQYLERQKREREDQAEKLQTANDFVRAVFRIFDGTQIEVGKATVTMECRVVSKSMVSISCRTLASDIPWFGTGSFERNVRNYIIAELRECGYYENPNIYFRYL